MPWWVWIIVISLSLVIAFSLIMFLITVGPLVKERFRRVKYSREAKRHNEKARLLRLEKSDYFGYPLPTGKEGTLRVTSDMMIHNPHRVSSRQLERAFLDRALDLKADILIENDVLTRDIVVTWRPAKGPQPKERY